MKKQLTSLALSVILTTATFGTALADNNFDTLRNKPMGAIEAGDALGLEVIPRSELEEVRGEAIPLILYYAILAAPSITYLLNSSIANHFPVMLIRQSWKSIRG